MTFPTPRFEKHRVKMGLMAALPIASAAGSIFSGIMGANSNAAQMAMAQRQFNQQLAMAEKQYQLQKDIADKQQEMATAGSRDARGNQTRYIPGVGWVTDPTAQTKALLNASDAEEMQRLGVDAARVRRGKQANEGTRAREAGIADAYRRQLESKSGEITPEQSQSRIADVMLSDIAERGNEAKNAIGLQAMRSGTTSNIASDIDKLATSGVRTALARSRMDAPIQANEQNQAVRNALLNSYNLMATRAGNSEDMGFQPTNVEAVPAAMMSRNLTMGPYGLQGASGSISRGAGDASTMMARGYGAMDQGYNTFRKNQPDYGLMISGLGEGLENLLKRWNNSSGVGSDTSGAQRQGAF